MKKFFLIVILTLAFILRFYRLGDYPALNADEAAIGYNAYSLLETGKDEHGNPWPIHFQSFNDYKPGLYFYMVMPLVKFIGLNAWAVRIPGALFGVATVYLVFLLGGELFSNIKFKTLNLELGTFAGFLLAISPWHIHFSRGGWEVNVATFFIVLGVLLFLKGKKNTAVLMLSVLSFVLSLYTYHAARIIVPLLGIGVLLIYRDSFRKNLKSLALVGLVGLVALLPLIKDFSRPEVSSRAAGVGIFADPGPLSRVNEQRGEHPDLTSITAKALHNKVANYSLAFFENWASHYHGDFLFLSGDLIQRNKVPDVGQMYLFDIVFLLVGLFTISRNFSKPWKLIIWWLVIAPTAAALTFQSPHALRAQNMVIPLVMISAYGLSLICSVVLKSKNKVLKYSFLSLLSLVIIWNFVLYLHEYYVHMAKVYPFSSQYGVKELVNFVTEEDGKADNKYSKILVTNRYDQPYILFLFYMKYPPQKFQESHQLTEKDQYGFSTVSTFDKFVFKSISWDVDQPKNLNSLIVGTEAEIPKEANIVKEIYGTNGYKYFEVVAN